jgi:hypothetical protein
MPYFAAVSSRTKLWTRRAAILVLVALAAYLFLPFLGSAVGAGASLVIAAIYVLAYLFTIVALPLVVFSLLKFAYSVFAKPYVRVWHINRIRNARDLKEASARHGNMR